MRSRGRIGRPDVERVEWTVAWSDLEGIEREGDRLRLSTPTIPRAIPIGPAPGAGVEDAAGLIAELRGRGFAVASDADGVSD